MLPLLLAAGCQRNSVKEVFGYGAPRSPDEFQVVRRAPLIVPPEYRLRPPQPGVEGPQQSAPATDAYTALTGRPQRTGASLSPAEQALVQATPGQPIPDIRQVLAQEDPQSTVLDRGTFLFILRWQEGNAPSDPNAVLDPVSESARLRGTAVVQTERTASAPITQ